MKRSLLALCPDAKDATSFYRGAGPLGVLKRQIPNLNLAYAMEYNWSTFPPFDALFVQRPFTTPHYQLIALAKNNNRPVWIDYDDDLFCVPRDNPAYKHYGPEAVQKTVAMCLHAADVVTVSTPALKRKLLPANPNVFVVPNAFNDDLFQGRRPEPAKERAKIMMWRGSASHQKDLAIYSHLFPELAKRHPDWVFQFVGYNPWFVTETLPDNQCVVVDPLDPVDFHMYLAKQQPAALTVPLVPNEFNLSKSNIAWIEAAFAGAGTIVPAWEEWDRPGAQSYLNPDEFYHRMDKAMSNPDIQAEHGDKAWQCVQDTLRLTVVNKMRFDVLETLFSKSPRIPSLGALS